ncbi:hypothetical protein [Streptomyces capoamus]|uniref:hypothetical protein n=1 Tax=Streptomyces capoamus TaxID=68183 RepID=UPI003397FB38
MTSFSDDFNRADSTDLGASWVEVSGDWSIVSQQLSPGAAGGTIILRAATAMASNDNFAQVTIAATTTASQGVWCRGNSNISQGYLWRNNGTSWDLFSVVGGSFTNLGTYAAAAAPGDVAKVQAVGTTITGYVNGVSRVSVTNSAVTTGTSVGIRSDSTSGVRYDNFSAGDVAASVTGTATASFGGLTAAASGVPTVTGTGSAAFGGLVGAASGTPTVRGTAAASLGALTAAAAGTPKVIGAGTFTGGSLTGTAGSVRTVIGSATASFAGLFATASAPSHVTGMAAVTFGGLIGTARGRVPGAVEQGSWWGLIDILREGAQLAREERERDPVACLDCGEPLRSGPRGERYCPFDGSIWASGGRRVGQVSTTCK